MKSTHLSSAFWMIAALVLSACTTTVQDPGASADHPAHPDAAEAPMSPHSTTLQRDATAMAEPAAAPPHTAHEGMQHDDQPPPPPEFQAQLGATVKAYFGVAAALAADDVGGATHAATAVRDALNRVDGATLPEARKAQWQSLRKALNDSLNKLAGAADLDAARAAFDTTSAQLTDAAKAFGVKDAGPVYRLFCPMAFGNRGAHWLQPDEKVANPYFGRRMARCGTVAEQIQAAPPRNAGHPHGGHE